MEKDILNFLKTCEGIKFESPDTPPDFNFNWWKEQLKADFPSDYQQLMSKIYTGSVSGKKLHMYFMNDDHIGNIFLDPFWMDPLEGFVLFGEDTGGNFLAFDIHNKLGKGTFAIFYVDHDDLRLSAARYIAKDLYELVTVIRDSDKHWWEFPTLED